MTILIDTVRISKHGDKQKLDRRIKLTDEQKETIRNAYFTTNETARPTQQSLAERYDVSLKTIQFVLYPEREVRQRALAKENRKTKCYYDKHKGRHYMQKHRIYKRQLIESGQLQVNE